jgi:hypothetical protein
MLGKAVGDTVRDFKKAVNDEPAKPAGAAELVPTTRDCPTCHKAVSVNDHFCGSCGAQLQVPAA